jgi:hypothetical protein
MKLLFPFCMLFVVTMIPNVFAEIDPYEFLDIRFNSIEKFQVHSSYTTDLFKLNISVYEPELVLDQKYGIQGSLAQFDLMGWNFGNSGKSPIDRWMFPDADAEYMKKNFGCDVELPQTRNNVYDLNLCYINKLAYDKQYTLKLCYHAEYCEFPLSQTLTNSAVFDKTEIIAEEKRLEEEKKKQYEENNPFQNLSDDSVSSQIEPESVPDWVKNIFLWYGQDQISETELLNAIKYLINEKILVVD